MKLNFQFSIFLPRRQAGNFQFNRGFTLAETVVFVGSFSILAIIATTTLFMVLGNVAKTRINQEIRRNGDGALQVMERQLKVAREIVSCNPTGITFFDQYDAKDASGNPTGAFACLSSAGNNWIASGSGQIKLTDPTKISVTDCNIFSCDQPGDPTLAIKWVKIDFSLTTLGTTNRTTEKTTVMWHSQINIRYQ